MDLLKKGKMMGGKGNNMKCSYGVCCPKNYACGSLSDIENSSSNKNNLERFILCRIERIRD